MEQGPEGEIIAPAKFGPAARKLSGLGDDDRIAAWRDEVAVGGAARLHVAAFDLLAPVLNRFPDVLETPIDGKRASVRF